MVLLITHYLYEIFCSRIPLLLRIMTEYRGWFFLLEIGSFSNKSILFPIKSWKDKFTPNLSWIMHYVILFNNYSWLLQPLSYIVFIKGWKLIWIIRWNWHWKMSITVTKNNLKPWPNINKLQTNISSPLFVKYT